MGKDISIIEEFLKETATGFGGIQWNWHEERFEVFDADDLIGFGPTLIAAVEDAMGKKGGEVR